MHLDGVGQLLCTPLPGSVLDSSEAALASLLWLCDTCV